MTDECDHPPERVEHVDTVHVTDGDVVGLMASCECNEMVLALARVELVTLDPDSDQDTLRAVTETYAAGVPDDALTEGMEIARDEAVATWKARRDNA